MALAGFLARHAWVGKGDGVDRGPFDAARVEELVDFRTNLEPGACDGGRRQGSPPGCCPAGAIVHLWVQAKQDPTCRCRELRWVSKEVFISVGVMVGGTG